MQSRATPCSLPYTMPMAESVTPLRIKHLVQYEALHMVESGIHIYIMT